VKVTQELNTSLIGKPIDELTPGELASLASQLSLLTTEIDARQKSVRDEAQNEVFAEIAKSVEEGIRKLAWLKLPKLTMVPDADGAHYTVAYASTKVKGAGGGKRTATDVNGGGITINKMSIAWGGIAWFKDKDGNEYEGIKELVKALKQPDGISEADRCWDISKKGISASDIVTKYHAEEVTLVFNDSTELLVKDAIEKMKTARAESPAS